MNTHHHHIQKIEPAHEGDLDEITAILNQAILWGNATAYTTPFTSDERRGWFEAHNREKFAIYVYRQERRVLGYLSLGAYRDGREAFADTTEVSYYVDFKHHRKGIATALMEKAFEHCQANEISTLLAFLYNHNTSSIIFLQKFGFEQWGLLPKTARAGGHEFDHVIYGKRVS